MNLPLVTLILLNGVIDHRESSAQEISDRSFSQQELQRSREDTILSIRQAPRSQGEERVRPQSAVSRESLRERLDSVLMILSRLGDRMVSIETKQNQQNERIDNVNYRITKLDVQSEDTKSKFSEIWSTLRHKLESSDRGMEQMNSLLDLIRSEVTNINSKTIQINTKMETLKHGDDGMDSRGRQLPKLQAVMTAIFGLKSSAEDIKKVVKSMEKNVTSLANSTRKFEKMQESLVTKEDLHLGLVGIRENLDTRPIAFVTQSSRPEKLKRDESTDCWELYHKRGKTKSGVYRVQPALAPAPFFVYCDMETDGGGWTVMQRREDGTEDFKRGWRDYKLGFGNLAGEFWLGNDKIFYLTNAQVNELRIELTDFSQTQVTASYSAFATGPESEGYALRLLSGYKGDAGDSLRYHVGQKWSTYDLDNDAIPNQNCARDHTGAWWYKSCETSNLNGAYLHGPVPPGEEYKGIYWYDFHGPQYSLWQTTMMMRRGGHAVVRKGLTVPPHIKHSPNIPHPLETPF